ncbi:MAG: hypothetical protein QOJ35_2515 [Solirubrobacteraceae bacterium]|jgi:uncharacterized protein YbjT (DUF2867 family)|nr:hypothetical protein [Solirubrobacteraceae bacterium]
MRILVTGVSGAIGSALVPVLAREGHELRGLARDPARVRAALPVARGDAVTGAGLDAALEGVDVAYYLIHSMEGGAAGFAARERAAAEHVVAAAARADVRRVVYLGGIVPRGRTLSRHLSSRLEVERILLAGFEEAVALRASIVVGASSRSFRFLVRLVERMRVLALPAWRVHRTQPIDVRDVRAFLLAAATTPLGAGGLSLDVAGPQTLTYETIVQRIADHMLVRRPALRLGRDATPIAAPIAAAIAGEDPGFITPLMESLSSDLLARDDRAPALLGVRRHSFDRAVEAALREWESVEPLRAR